MKELNAFRKFLAEDRGEFGQESIDKLRDTIEAMGNSEAHQKAFGGAVGCHLAMVSK